MLIVVVSKFLNGFCLESRIVVVKFQLLIHVDTYQFYRKRSVVFNSGRKCLILI